MLEDLYRDIILDHYRHPKGAGTVAAADHRAEGQNPLCGDECSVALSLDGDRVREVEYRGRGCSISVASGSMMAGEIRGRSLAEVRALGAAVKSMLQGKGRDPAVELGDLEALEGVSKFPVRIKCALLPWSTLSEALARPAGAGEGEGGAEAVTTEEPGKDAVRASDRRAGGL
jgi:nitrogen fixation protein NifU and related proteins